MGTSWCAVQSTGAVKIIKRATLATDIFFADGVLYSAKETNVGLTGVYLPELA